MRHPAHTGMAWLLIAVLTALGATEARAQVNRFYLANEATTVSEVSFKFVDHQTFDVETLKMQIATDAPTLWTRVQQAIPLLFSVDETFDFDPVTLQKDVIRLKQYYRRNGFLTPRIDYPASQFDTTANAMHVIFTVREGPPLIIQDAGFYGADSTSYAVRLFDDAPGADDLRQAWIDFRDGTGFRVGERYTAFRRLQTEDAVATWMRNQGFAFANVASEVRIDSTNNVADIRFFLDPGPRARVAEVRVSGNESVDASIVRRELPFEVGDRFSAAKLQQGQQQLFGLNLFRVAVAEVPDQPRDTSVVVLYRVREANLRVLSGQMGYGTLNGVTSEAQWTHRNFFGGARTFTAGVVAETGFFSNPDFLGDTGYGNLRQRRFRGSLSLTQPYLLVTQLTGNVQPFIEYRRDPKLEDSNEALNINARDFGLETRLIYDLGAFRNVTLRHTFTRSLQFTQVRADADTLAAAEASLTNDLFNRSVFGLSAALGTIDDVLNPTRGYEVRPQAELAGTFLRSDIEFGKLSVEVTGYRPVNGWLDLAGRLFVGQLWPFGRSRDGVRGERLAGADLQRFENRFDPALYYAGGSADVRGWAGEQAGPKVPRVLGEPFGATPADSLEDNDVIYEPVGGTRKLAFGVEARLPFPGLPGESWRTALFVDGGLVSGDVYPPVEPGAAVDGRALVPARNRLRVGAGGGLRYRTPVGFLRLDVAYKVNPGPYDLREPRDVYRYLTNPDAAFPDPRFWRRFRIHVGIGQSF